MAKATMTTTTHAEFIPELWAVDTLDAVEFSAQLQKRVLRDYEGGH